MTLFTKCDRPIMGRLTDVFFRLFGPKEKNFDEGAFNKSIKMGNFSPPNRRCSPIICIPGEQLKPTGESVFKFTVNGCHRLSPSSKLSLGHDAPQKSSDWFVEKVSQSTHLKGYYHELKYILKMISFNVRLCFTA